MASPYAYKADDAQVTPDQVISNVQGPRYQSWIRKEPTLTWFLTDPTDPKNGEAGYWIKAEVVDGRDGFVGTTAPTPNGCATIPVAPPILLKMPDGRYTRQRQDDVMYDMVRPNKYNASSGRTRGKAVRYTEYIDADGNLRLMEMGESQYQQILTKFLEWNDEAEDNETTFDVTAQPYMLHKSADGRVITIRKATRKDGYAKIDPVDWPQPSNLYEHVDAVRQEIDTFLIGAGLAHYVTSVNSDGETVQVLTAGPGDGTVPPTEDTDEPPATVTTPEAEIAGVGTTMLRRALVAIGVTIPEGAKRPQLLELATERADEVAAALK
jgi:hypothetical protein